MSGPNRLIWVGFATPDADRPPGPMPTEFESYDEALAIQARYRDVNYEVIAPDGRLVAHVRFDDIRNAPTPISASRWILLDDDPLQSIVLQEPVLISR